MVGETELKEHSKIKKTKEDILVDFISYFFMAVFALTILFPFMSVISKAFSADWAVIAGKVGVLPVGFQLDSIRFVVQSNEFLNSFRNSFLITLTGTFATLLVTGMTAYPLSKRYLPGMKQILLLFVFTMYFNGGMIPTYLWMKNLGLLNNLSVLVLPALINVFHMLIIKNYYEGLPDSIEESAKLDGAGNFTILFRIVMPLSIPVYASIAVFTSVGLWNNYLSAMLYINSPGLKTLPLYLHDLIAQAQDALNQAESLSNINSESVTSSAIIASTLPILLVYPFLQRYFIKGITIGSVKG